MSNGTQNQTEIEKFKKAFKGKSQIASGDEGANLLRAASKDGKKVAVIRKAAMKFYKERPETLQELTKAPEGRDLLQKIVAGMDTASSNDEKTFVEAAIKAQYNIDVLEGHLTTKALPRLFKVLGQVPDWHVRENDKVVKIKRFKREDVSDDDSKKRSVSWYKKADDDKQEPAEIVLNLGRTKETEYYYPNATKTKVNSFDVTTLHEVGHAVDDSIGYMKKKMKQEDYGSWEEDIPFRKILIEVVGKHFKFYEKYKQYPRKVLDDYLEDVATKGVTTKPSTWDTLLQVADMQKIETIVDDDGIKFADQKRLAYLQTGRPDDLTVSKDKGDAFSKSKLNKSYVAAPIIDLVVDAGMTPREAATAFKGDVNRTPADFDEIAKHAAVKWLLSVGMTADDNGLWDGGDTAAKNAEINGRVYQLAYRGTGKWVSYDIGARATSISTYQFRAPGEWFAELYALYFIGELPKGHKSRKWLEEEIDTDTKPVL